MLNFNINLTSLAVILWCGMLIIAGSIWVLASQVGRLAELMSEHNARTSVRPSERLPVRSEPSPLPSVRGRVAVRGVATAQVRLAHLVDEVAPHAPMASLSAGLE